MQKMIIMPGTGILPKNGGMYGPINTPFRANTYEIGLMLQYGGEVFEVLENGTKVKLTEENYDKDNNNQEGTPAGPGPDATPDIKEPEHSEENPTQPEETPGQEDQPQTIAFTKQTQDFAIRNGKRK